MQFSKLNFNRIPYLIAISILIIALLVFIGMSIFHQNWGSFIALSVVLLIILVLLVLNGTTNIRIGQEGITSEGLFKTTVLSWQDVRQFGVVVYAPLSRFLLPREEWGKSTPLATKYIFITGSAESPLKLCFRPEEKWIKFHYRPEAILEIEKWKKGI